MAVANRVFTILPLIIGDTHLIDDLKSPCHIIIIAGGFGSLTLATTITPPACLLSFLNRELVHSQGHDYSSEYSKSSTSFSMSLDHIVPTSNASDPYATFVNASCIELLLIEMLPTALRISHDTMSERRQGEKELDEDEHWEAAQQRLDALGYRVGQGLVERYSRVYSQHLALSMPMN